MLHIRALLQAVRTPVWVLSPRRLLAGLKLGRTAVLGQQRGPNSQGGGSVQARSGAALQPRMNQITVHSLLPCMHQHDLRNRMPSYQPPREDI